jgi:hypothetical protein
MPLVENLMTLCGAVARAAFLSLYAVPLVAQVFIYGVVKEDSSGKPLSRVDVSIEKSNRATRTDSSGHYFLDAPAGNQVVLFRVLGFQVQRVRIISKKNDTTQVDATMLRDVAGQHLDPVAVTGRMPARGMGREAFAERKANGLGKFIDSTELRKAEGRRLSDFLRGAVGVRMVEYRTGTMDVQLRAASPIQMGMDGQPNCWVSVVFDNVTIYRTGSRGDPPDLGKEFRPENLDAIEYYKNRAETPLEFSALGGDCGVLVLWSRRGK